jgi:hypothetical protein
MEAGGVKDAEFIATIVLDQAEAELSEKQLESWVLLILDGASNNTSAMPKMKGKPFFHLRVGLLMCTRTHACKKNDGH